MGTKISDEDRGEQISLPNLAGTNYLIFIANKIVSDSILSPEKLKFMFFVVVVVRLFFNVVVLSRKKNEKGVHNLPLGWSWSHTEWSVTSLSFVILSSFAESDMTNKQNL